MAKGNDMDFPFRYPTDSCGDGIVGLCTISSQEKCSGKRKKSVKYRNKIRNHTDFNMDVVESVNVHDDIKIGLPYQETNYIANYIRRSVIWLNLA